MRSVVTGIVAGLLCSLWGVDAVTYDSTGTAGGGGSWTYGSHTAMTITDQDSIKFIFSTGSHTVAQVTGDCDCPCTGTTLSTTGPYTWSASGKAGQSFSLFCTFPGHCADGMKLKVTVVAPTAAPTPVPTPVGGTASPVAGSSMIMRHYVVAAILVLIVTFVGMNY